MSDQQNNPYYRVKIDYEQLAQFRAAMTDLANKKSRQPTTGEQIAAVIGSVLFGLVITAIKAAIYGFIFWYAYMIMVVHQSAK